MRISSPVSVQASLSALPGFSSHQLQCDALQASFSSQATNGNFLAAMTAASGAFSLGRALGTSLFSNVMSGALLRGSSWSLGFVGEVLTFRGVNQLSNPGSESFLNPQGLASTAMDFLFLKGAGALLGGQSFGVRQGVQALAMVGGEYAGEALHLRESSARNFSERYANALVTGLAMESGGYLARLGAGGRLESLQRGLNHSLRMFEGRSIPHSASSMAQGRESISFMAARNRYNYYKMDLPELMTWIKTRKGAVSELSLRVYDNRCVMTADHLEQVVEALPNQPHQWNLASLVVILANKQPELFTVRLLTRLIRYSIKNPWRRDEVGMALSKLVISRPELFRPCHISKIIEVASSNESFANALDLLARWKPLSFTEQHLTDILFAVSSRQTTTEWHGVGSWEGESSLTTLAEQRPDLFNAYHLRELVSLLRRRRGGGEVEMKDRIRRGTSRAS